MRNNDSRAAVRLELTDPLLKDVEEWRRSQAKIPSRTEAIRRLTKQALASDAKGEDPAAA
jgi:metal-responsive CopG/Arc/MetJ family transcriptional regulator